MKTKTKERDWVEEVGAPAYSAIAEMVAALQCDRGRLEELQEERDGWEADPDPLYDHLPTAERWAAQNPDDAAELKVLEDEAGEADDEEAARERIQEDPLSLRIFGERTDGEWEATGYELLLTTGGPAVRIVGDLEDGEATRARLEVQDWGKPWTEYLAAENDVLMAYVGCFCFE